MSFFLVNNSNICICRFFIYIINWLIIGINFVKLSSWVLKIIYNIYFKYLLCFVYILSYYLVIENYIYVYKFLNMVFVLCYYKYI